MPTFGDAIREMAGKNGWSKEQIEVLLNASEDEYFDFFKSIDMDEHLDTYIRTCLQFGTFTNDDEGYKRIYANAVAALSRIAGQSRLNAVRLARFLPRDSTGF